jgi:hypothetical protein
LELYARYYLYLAIENIYYLVLMWYHKTTWAESLICVQAVNPVVIKAIGRELDLSWDPERPLGSCPEDQKFKTSGSPGGWKSRLEKTALVESFWNPRSDTMWVIFELMKIKEEVWN